MTKTPKQTLWAWSWSFLVVFVILFWLIYASNLSSQVENEAEEVTEPKVATLSDFSHNLMIEKPGKFASSQDIIVTSQANWKVSAIYFKEGQEVKWGQPVVALSDTIASYKLQVDNAKNALNRAILTKQQTELQINQQIESAKNAYENAQKGFDLAKKSSEISVKQVRNSVSSADSSIDTLRNSFLALKNWTINYLDTVIDTSDALLWVSKYYEDNLDKGIEVYVWAKDATKKENAKQQLRDLYKTKDEIKTLADIPEDIDQLKTSVNKLDSAAEQISKFWGTMVEVMRNSIASDGSLSQATIDKYISSFQWFEATSAAWGTNLRWTITSFKSQVDAQISWSWTLAQENANLTLEDTINKTENALFQAEIGLKNAKIAYDTVLENKDVQLAILDNAIVSAKIGYESALTQYNKLSVRSPVTWIIWEILTTEWQEVWAGTQMFKVSGIKKQQIEVYITSDEYQYIQSDKPVEVVYQEKVLTWNIDSISTVADRTNLFKATIQLNSDVSLLWDIAKVRFPIKVVDNTILPLDLVKILNDNEWEVKIWSWDTTEWLTIEIKKVWWNFVELKEELPWDTQIIVG